MRTRSDRRGERVDARRVQRTYRPGEDRPIRAAILRVADDHYFWYTRAHHVIMDGFGAVTFMDRVATIYSAMVEGP